jgi:alpha/beta superfamily hydrolase
MTMNMKPIVFGPPERRLFGFFHAPQKAMPARAGLLMCYPFGHEATRAHRLFRVLAERLARQGVAVLRFDYFGTGDSPGDDADGEMEGWCSDILQAHAELKRLAEVRSIHWLASRLGATMAVQAAGRAEDLNRLVLWDPIIDGPAYVRELRVEHMAALTASFYAKDKSWYRAHPESDTAPLSEAIGFGINGKLAAQLPALRAADLQVPAHAAAVVFANPADQPAAGWCRQQQRASQPIRFEPLVHPIVWTSDPLADSAIVPAEVTQRFSALFHEPT